MEEQEMTRCKDGCRNFPPEPVRPRLHRERGIEFELACLLSARKGAAKNKTTARLTQYSSNNSWYMNWNNENLNNNNKNNNNYVRAFAAKRFYTLKRRIMKHGMI